MWRLAVLAVLPFALVSAAVAAGDRSGDPVTVVTTPAPGGSTVDLRVQDTSGGGLCLDVVTDGMLHADAACLAPPSSAAGDVQPHVLRLDGYEVVYGATTTGTTRVRLSFASRTVTTTTTRSSYAGDYAGRVRFYAVALAHAPAIGSVTALASDGTARAARDLNQLALPANKGRASLASLTDEVGEPATLLALDTRILAPQPARPDRRKRALCLGVRQQGDSAPLPGRSLCTVKRTRVDVRFSASCDTGRTVVYGIAPLLIHRAAAVFADGSQRNLRLITVPKRLGHRSRAVLLTVSGASPSSVLGYDARGRVIATVRLSGGSC
jgi:hypothetical protein